MRELESLKRLDGVEHHESLEPCFSTDYLWGDARGQMFGVLECEDKNGQTVILKAFSCQYNGQWFIKGWAPPIFDMVAYEAKMIPGDLVIKELTRKMESLDDGSVEFSDVKMQRKHLSQNLMKDLQGLYLLRNFHGERKPLMDFFHHTNGPPTGAGDCCAPKLLNQAATLKLNPIALAEFFWGKSNRSNTRQHGSFYSSCEDKCLPILGFMLCGAEL